MKARGRPGDREGTEPVVALPSLDALLAEPARVAQLPRQALLEARRAAQKLVADLDMAVALVPAPSAAAASTDGQDPLLSPSEAAQILRRSERWIRRHGRELPGRVVLSKKAIGYQRAALERLIRQRATPPASG